MRRMTRCLVACLGSAATIGFWIPAALAQQGTTIEGEQLDPSTYGPSYVESMEAAIARDRLTPRPIPEDRDQDHHGVWVVPTRGASRTPSSGSHYVVNKWGDTRMGIGFGGAGETSTGQVNVHGAYFFGQADEGVWTTGIQVIGYRDGREVQETEWFRQIGAEPQWFAMNLRDVDRIEIVAEAVANGGGWYGMDDLTYSVADDSDDEATTARVVVDFDDLSYRYELTGSGYMGLTWEVGTGQSSSNDAVHGPMVPAELQRPEVPEEPETAEASPQDATQPNLITTFQGVIRGDAGSMSYPPDTDGAVGPNHYLETVNRNFAVYDKQTGEELINILLGSFLPGSNGDPRCLFDHHSGRWVVIVTDFNATATIFLAVSMTDDPTGDWFKTSFLTAQGSDAGAWPDYPTLGVDAYGVYTAAYMVGGGGMTIWAIDKEPLIDDSPSLGTITAFRNLPWEGAIQPAHTYGTPEGEYLISWFSSSALRVRRINPPMTSPTITEVGIVSVPYFSSPPNAPALGSYVPINTVDERLMMSVYRDGSIWTSHTISVDGRAGCRWYEIDAATPALIQSGTVADASLYYYFPSVMVNHLDNVAMAFSGSNALQYVGCYYTGRRLSDPSGEMGVPVQFKEGTAPQNNIDGYGRNRWGDYSYTTLDPVGELYLWTIQEYGHEEDIWGTYVAVLSLGDCNENEIPDECDIDCGPPGGECDVPGCGGSLDCDYDGLPDECEDPNPQQGRITFTVEVPSCDTSGFIRLADCALNTDSEQVEEVTVQVTSDTEPGGEPVTLTETDPASGLFEGFVALGAVDDTGVLMVSEGDTVVVTYIDADDGAGGVDVTVTAEAAVEDCTPPSISNVGVTDIQPHEVTVTFTTDEPAASTVRFGLSCDALDSSVVDDQMENAHAIVLAGLDDGTKYYFAVDAVDDLGNTATDDHYGACYIFYTPLIFFEDTFETDQGWTVENIDLLDGAWQRGIPAGDGSRGDPLTDYDGSGQCYLTANRPGNSDVDGGPTRLISPLHDLSGTTDPMLGYARWWTNDDQDGDQLEVEISNDGGGSWVLVEGVLDTVGWVKPTIRISDFIAPSDQMQLRFSAADNPSNSIDEGAVDFFRITTFDFGSNGDFDFDMDVDLADCAAFMRCFDQSADAACEPGNMAGGTMIDLDDYALFAADMNGPQ